MARRNQGRKRQDYNAHEVEAPVDDMAVAASYAAAVYQTVVAPVHDPKAATADSNEINLSDNDDDDQEILAKKAEDASSSEDSDSSVGSDDNDDEEDNPLIEDHDTEGSDDELDVEKERSEIAKMQANNQSDTTNHSGEGMAAPRTENELDPYQTPLPELEKAFQLNLAVEESHQTTLSKLTTNDKHGSLNICLAGKIKSHLVQERTVIVESIPQKDGSLAPLDEGSLLVFRIQGKDAEEQPQLVPLGKVFEVFGPVRKPLYSVRIPAPPQKSKKGKKEQSVSKSSPEEPVQLTSDVKDTTTKTAKPDGQTNILVSDTGDKEVKQEPPSEKKAGTTTTDTKVPVESSEQQSCQTTSNDNDKSSNAEEPDPWSQNGKYTSLLVKNPEFEAFYVKDEAKTIDAEAILRMSAKGCDASNIFDEEVVNVNEMAFSDDEEERQLKNRRKTRNKETGKDTPRRRSNHQSNNRQWQTPIPSGFNQHPYQQHQVHRQPYHGAIPPPPPPRGPPGGTVGIHSGTQFSHPPHPGPYAYAHHPMHPPQQQYPPQHQPQPYAGAYPPSYPPQQYAPYPHPQYAPFPPHNPPHHQQPYPITGQGHPPPPPPPGAPPPSSANTGVSSSVNTSAKTQQQSDTVYYDYS